MINKNIILFGSTGMLGRYVLKYLKSHNLNIFCIDRKEYDASSGQFNTLKNLIKSYDNGNTVIINCVGLIPQTNNRNELDYIKINSIFPQHLAIISRSFSINFIHITTDCVFNGIDKVNKFPGYSETSIKNETGIYGMSKSLGENIQATVIRTSIIGEQTNKSYLSLLEWVKSKKNLIVDGYTNHYWNGVTCLQLAKVIYQIILTDSYWIGIRHIHTKNYVSKYNLLEKINKIYNLNIQIIPATTKLINKTLSSIYELKFNIPDFDTQLLELKNFDTQI
jgi:dTDP-4-dehydrorhamnose reductase